MSSRERILNKLRSASQPVPDAPPRPAAYRPLSPVADTAPDALLARFTQELTALYGEVFPVTGQAAACEKVFDLLRGHNASHILAWDFAHIPVPGLENAIREAGITISQPQMHDEFRAETVETIRDAQAGLTGADAAVAATGTLIFTTAPGKGRLPTVLAPVHIAVITIDQLLPRLENWVAGQRARNLEDIRRASNVCFVSGPSRTADIEMVMIRGVHGPGRVQVVVIE
jgi:L-lactate dehydrogenase complex protein LldG